ncbi:MAG: Cof-type HAD-IIB family hydrolase [Peptococcaceae bacterium]|jgi:Cof subfamily protein (haloacid dehalogenase superfamily)|nr:Cof-type HAD-IIB family hydrolase [Peptococcaceae bacterium]
MTPVLPAYPVMPPVRPDIRLVAIDLDDTMLREDCTISERCRQAIQNARAGGVAVTIATGRMYTATLPYARELAIDIPLITYQGAMVIMTDGRLISHRILDQALSLELLDFLLPYGHHINMYIKDQIFIENASREAKKYGARTGVYLQLVPGLRAFLLSLGGGVTKFTMAATAEALLQVKRDVDDHFRGRIWTVLSRPTFLEFGRPDVNKGIALADLAKDMGIDREQVMAIGDSPNDLEMVTYAGWGIAMANAEDCVKEKARWVTASNEEDGVAIALEMLVAR